MDLGQFSVSLAVADLQRSRAFYATLGFEQIGGDEEKNWLILQNGSAVIGLFHGMFDSNILTFNPTDARAIEARLITAGVVGEKTTQGESGPAHFVVSDPDGNTLLIDQHG